ncbi:hypothetical protein QQ045_009361 [Rhodiola kirilowii]
MDLVTVENSGEMVDDLRLDVIAETPSDFDSWTSLISHVEKLYDEDEEKICSIYDSFLSDFPLCYGYWRKYASHMIRLCTFDKIIEVFERAVLAVTYSVDVWLDYCVFCMSLFPDPNDIRRQFKRGLSYIERDYLCHTLWDKYIEFEFSQQNWSALAYIYIQILRYPKRMLHDYYDRFTQLVAMFKEEMERQGTFVAEIDSVVANGSSTVYTDDELLSIIKDLLDDSDNLPKTKAWQKYKLFGESLHRQSCRLDEKIHCFENQICRTYFHIKPLNAKELENWHQYLDFVEEQGDFDWAVKLYERCLIPCALYTDFWIRYVQLLESKGGRELANFALDRATKTFLKTTPSIHLFNARYKEQTRDVNGARAAIPKFNREELDSKFITNVMEQANMERRLGNYEAAYRVYREAIEMATERKKLDMLSCLYIHYSRLTYKATNTVGAALSILADGIKQIPYCQLLLKELMKFGMMHGGPKDVNTVDFIVANALTSKESQYSLEEKESISLFFLELVDLCGTIYDLMKAWTRHIKLFPHSVRTASNGEPPLVEKSADVVTSKAKDLCVDVDLSACRASSLDKPDQLQCENQTEPREQLRSEGSEFAHDKLGNVSVPSSSNLAGDSAADLRLLDINNNTDPNKDAKGSIKPSDIQHEDDQGIDHNINSLRLGDIAVSNENKGSPNVTTTLHNEYGDLEDLSRKKTPENILVAEFNPSASSSLQDQRSTETHVAASSDSGQCVRVNPSTEDQRFLQSSLSPSGTPRSVSSYVPKSSTDLPSAGNENYTQNFQGNPETARDWHLRRRPERFIKDAHSRHRPTRQGHFRSDSDHIITIQRNAAQPLPMKTQKVQDNQTQSQQPWVSNQFNPALNYSWPMQNMQQNVGSTSQSQLPAQPIDQASAQMPQYSVQVDNVFGQMQNQQAYDQMMQYYYYQQQLQFPQQWQQTPDQWQQQQQQQQQYWLQLQQQQQVAQVPVQQEAQVATQMQMQQHAQAPLQMHLQAQMPMAAAGSQAPLIHQQQLQQLLELQQLKKQQLEHQQPQQDKVQMQQQPAPSSPEIQFDT